MDPTRSIWVCDLTHTDFKSKKVRVNLQIPVRAEQKAESSEVLKTVEEDRKMLLQATIVRYVHGLIQYHESTQDAQAQFAFAGSDYPGPIAVSAQGAGHQEGHRCSDRA